MRMRMPSATAIQSAILMRFWPRETLVLAITLKLPRRRDNERAAEAAEVHRGALRLLGSAEQPVDGGAGAAHVGTEGPELGDAGGERRGGEVVGRQRGEVARLQRLEQVLAPLLEPRLAVEAGIDGSGRLLDDAVREDEEHGVVARQLDAIERRAVARAELRAERQEERHVRPERCRQRMQLIVRQRLVERLVGDPESGRRV